MPFLFMSFAIVAIFYAICEGFIMFSCINFKLSDETDYLLIKPALKVQPIHILMLHPHILTFSPGLTTAATAATASKVSQATSGHPSGHSTI